MLVVGIADGADIIDFLPRDLVLPAGGAANCAATLVLDRVFCDGAMDSTTGVDPVRRLLLVVGFFATGNCAVVVGAGAGLAGSTLGSGVGTTGLSFPMDFVMRILVGMLFVSTLRAGCTLGTDDDCMLLSLSMLTAGSVCVMRWRSHRSCDVSMCLIPLTAFAQSVIACMILSCGVMEGLVMFLCWN